MAQADPMEDSFEKARRAFFGSETTTPEMSASSDDFFQPQNRIPPQEIVGPSLEKYEAAQPLIRTPRR
jgi:hypothetical protein